MPQVEHTATVAAPLNVVWEFTRDMSNWAPFVAGYQKHEVLSDADSMWWLKGEVGGVTRMIQFRVHITEWAGPERVTFVLEGVNEPMKGSGIFSAAPYTEAAPEAAPSAPARSWFERFRAWLTNFLFSKVFRRQVSAAPSHLGGRPQSRLTFKLEMSAGGTTGPLVNALVAPMLAPVAQDLANRIGARVEELHAGRAAAQPA